MTEYKIKGQSGTVEQTTTLPAESPEQALEDAKKYFPERMHGQLSVSSADSENRNLLQKNGYPEWVVDSFSDEECEGECEAVGIV
ncbi:hypothetical protein AB432_018460 [Brevibacillus brevis]|uniref:Uncharacterized protein n=1 Tax=Brevibacillus brevis TaxID=1393 RepID=A0A2Z4MK34_BREBE|nr:hypothetical protein [Brevibacillus brevis]AWX56907.1 hypothetical protein AB432_018460 [Brevibacillus brevis]